MKKTRKDQRNRLSYLRKHVYIPSIRNQVCIISTNYLSVVGGGKFHRFSAKEMTALKERVWVDQTFFSKT
jgi:hypothetical protein